MEKLFKTFGVAIVGAVLGFIIGMVLSGDLQDGFFLGVIGSGIIYGWTFINKYLGSLVVGDLALMTILFCFKLMAAILIGWIILAVKVIKEVVIFIMGRRKMNMVND